MAFSKRDGYIGVGGGVKKTQILRRRSVWMPKGRNIPPRNFNVRLKGRQGNKKVMIGMKKTKSTF